MIGLVMFAGGMVVSVAAALSVLCFPRPRRVQRMLRVLVGGTATTLAGGVWWVVL